MLLSLRREPKPFDYKDIEMSIFGNVPRAFTLIELLIVVTIIAILAAIAVPNFLEAQTRSKVSKVKTDMRAVATGLEAYAVDYNRYPPNVLDPAGRGNVMNMMSGKMPFVPYTLTTPVAYMSRVPLDTFKPRVMQDHVHSFMYFNSTNTPNAENRLAYRARVNGKPMTDRSYPEPRWVQVSTGPDLKMGTMAQEIAVEGDLPIYQIMVMPMGGMMNMGSIQQYDPTNGTVSEGDLVRFGP